jgi:transposase
VVRRRLQYPCRSCSGGGEKGGAEVALGRSHGGWGSKIHLLTDGRGLPLEVLVSAGQRHESCFFEPLLERLLAQGRKPKHLLGDKGYSAPRIRGWLAERSIMPVIPHRKDELRRHPETPPLDTQRYRKRNVVERAIGFLKQSRSVATRFDKLPKCFLAMIKLAFIKLYLRKIDSSDTA